MLLRNLKWPDVEQNGRIASLSIEPLIGQADIFVATDGWKFFSPSPPQKTPHLEYVCKIRIETKRNRKADRRYVVIEHANLLKACVLVQKYSFENVNGVRRQYRSFAGANSLVCEVNTKLGVIFGDSRAEKYRHLLTDSHLEHREKPGSVIIKAVRPPLVRVRISHRIQHSETVAKL